jgi:hypothetical protein
MSGPELAAASSARRPGLPVLFTSGYTGKAGGKDDPLRSDAPMLRKPYALDTLARAIRRAIDGAGSCLPHDAHSGVAADARDRQRDG